ncbi:MAG: hypothetical protein ACKVUS_00565 [Saprospiraceae bacterium]
MYRIALTNYEMENVLCRVQLAFCKLLVACQYYFKIPPLWGLLESQEPRTRRLVEFFGNFKNCYRTLFFKDTSILKIKQAEQWQENKAYEAGGIPKKSSILHHGKSLWAYDA